MIRQIQGIISGSNTIYSIQIEQSFDIDMRKARTFASCGNEETVFKLKKSIDGQVISADVNFEKTRLRDEIPEFAGIYYLKHSPIDISSKKKLCFEACSKDESIRIIWVEIKPEGKKWMHESFDFELTSEMATYEIEIADFENPDTTRCIEEITFVIKPVSFANEDCLKGCFSIGSIKVL